MGAAMLPETAQYGVPFGTGNRWLKMCMQRSQAQPLFKSNYFTEGKNASAQLCVNQTIISIQFLNDLL